MEINPGRKIALAVERGWYKTIAKHKFLKDSSLIEHSTEVFAAVVEDLNGMHGIWVRPDERFSDFPESSLFVPWSVIIAAVLLGPDDEKKLCIP